MAELACGIDIDSVVPNVELINPRVFIQNGFSYDKQQQTKELFVYIGGISIMT